MTRGDRERSRFREQSHVKWRDAKEGRKVLVGTEVRRSSREKKAGMRNLKESDKALRELLQERILVLDGAMGTMLQQRSLTAADFGGAALEGCNENLVRTRPDVVLEIHRKYFEAGSNIVETQALEGRRWCWPKRAATLARQAAEEYSTSGKPRFVAGSMGPTTKAITVTGVVTFEGLLDDYYVQAKGLNAPANSGRLGISGSGGNDDGAAVHIEIPRETV